MTRAALPAASDRWSLAHQRLHSFLSPAEAARWWITPIEGVGWISPIEAWEEGRQGDVERFIGVLARQAVWW